MDCIERRYQIAELVDGALPGAEAAELKAHIRGCPGCRREQAILQMLSAAVAALPQYRPGRQFNDRVLLSLGLRPVGRLVPAWLRWAIAGGAAVSAAWTGLVVYAAVSHMSVIGALKALQLASRPREVLSALGLYAVKLGFAASDSASALAAAVSPSLQASGLPLQLAIASVVSFGLISLISLRTRKADC